VIPFERDDNGELVASLTEPELALISSLATQIADLLDELGSAPHIADPDAAALYESIGIGGSTTLNDDPAIARLLPNAYADDLDASRDFRGLTERSLAARKVANARAVVASLDAARSAAGELRLDAALEQSWMRTLVDIRLTIAARLGIEHDDEGRADADADAVHESHGDESHGDEDHWDSADESLVLRDVYDWLGWVSESLMEAIE
jgi:hypothetical protein